MPQPNKIPLAFAASGDKNIIPESTETTGLASWRDGFPAITSAPFSEGGIAPKRADFNGIFNALSQAVMWMQQGGVYAYDVNTDYEAGNVVLDAGGLYVANASNGPSSTVVQPSSDTTGATWKLVRLDLATQSAAGYMSAADKAKLDGLISTLATQTAAGYMSATDKAVLDGVPTTYLPLSGGTMTGTIESTVDTIFKKSTTTGSLIVLSGNNAQAASGANIVLRGGGHASNPGEFTLHAGNGNGYKQLVGKPDGTLTWDSLPLVCGEFYTDHCKLNNKIEMECGYVEAAVGENVVTFKRAFTVRATPRVFVQPWVNDAVTNANVYSLSKTGFRFNSSRAIGVLYFVVSFVE